ncbi:heat shock protein hsp20 [Psychroflexus gondwanensis ACAM 44]|jgi:HSP20 family protein|uniref:Heat shock protein hsp20 n=1 Tax=Psychroflexus gondwanensis ACAM 44 TaxID=1189619 RepID=N1WS45_9FLAO|nr:Hsp20/alpha crystallin family protein [Psychroflexus gondwanensis]EMY81835.1 heat shock protein hsp20 [Psychroflexus gondwanensis ACAM 44]
MIPTRFSTQDLSLMDRLFNADKFHRDFSETNSSSPLVNIKQAEDKYSVEMSVPGFDKNDFNIELNENELIISSEKEENKEQEGEKYTRKEFSYQSFRRSFTLPETVDGDKISAQYKDGVLYVDIPKREEAKPKLPKQIAVK